LDGHYKREIKVDSLASGAPKGMAIDAQGRIFIPLDIGVIQVFDQKGEFLFHLGTYGPAAGEFISPRGIYIDSADRLYVTDTGNQRVQIFQIPGPAKSVTAAVSP
jgi:sugar lactone lactonase YvrE